MYILGLTLAYMIFQVLHWSHRDTKFKCCYFKASSLQQRVKDDLVSEFKTNLKMCWEHKVNSSGECFHSQVTHPGKCICVRTTCTVTNCIYPAILHLLHVEEQDLWVMGVLSGLTCLKRFSRRTEVVRISRYPRLDFSQLYGLALSQLG